MGEIHNQSIGALPTAAGGITRLGCTVARAAGVDLKPLLAKAGLTEQQIEDRGTRLSVQHQIRFLNLLAEALHDDLLGFHLAQRPDLRELGLLYYVAASSDTLADALRRAARYSAIDNEGVSIALRDDADLRIGFDYVGVARHQDRHQIEFFMTVMIRLCRQLTGLDLIPSCVRLTHARGEERNELAPLFGEDIHFGARADELIFPGAFKNTALASADPYLNQLLVANGEKALSRNAPPRGPFRSAVENAIVPLLPHGKARAAEVAKRLGVSQRTAARRLALEGVTFSDVLEALRAALARQYLADQALSISRIAWLLGYQEVSAFTHAFKRWTGKTPREAR